MPVCCNFRVFDDRMLFVFECFEGDYQRDIFAIGENPRQ